MDFDLDLSSESMSSFLELEHIPEVKADPQMSRPSVIITKKTQKMKTQPILTDIMSNCGILKELNQHFCRDPFSPDIWECDGEQQHSNHGRPEQCIQYSHCVRGWTKCHHYNCSELSS